MMQVENKAFHAMGILWQGNISEIIPDCNLECLSKQNFIIFLINNFLNKHILMISGFSGAIAPNFWKLFNVSQTFWQTEEMCLSHAKCLWKWTLKF